MTCLSKISLKSIKQHDYRLVAVPSELLPCESPSEVEEIYDEKNNQTYEVKEWIEQVKGHVLMRSMFLLATGSNVNAAQIWAKYPESDKVYLFVCGLKEKEE
jgi:hypothetical protein